jgi:hypothetical protein
MTMPNESKMLQAVRKWRREAFEADINRPQAKRAENARKLASVFGLEVKEPAADIQAGREAREENQPNR